MSLRRGPLAALSVAVAVAGTVGVLAAAGGIPEVPLGLPDPGPFTSWGLPLANLATLLLAFVVVAALIAAPLTAVRTRDELTPLAARAVRTALLAACGWLVLTLVQLWLTVSDQFAIKAWDLTLSTVIGFAQDAPQGKSLSAQLFAVTLLLIALPWVHTARRALFALGLALFTLVPVLLTGHSASSGSHDTAIVAIVAHVLPVAVWIGGVVALWWHLGAESDVAHRAARRFSSLAAWCFGLTAVSGLLSAWLRLGGVAEFFTTGYGQAVVAKVITLVLIGLVAAQLRSLVRNSFDAATWQKFAGLSAIELICLALAAGIGVALARTPSPIGEPYVSAAESLLGGPLPPAPDASRLFFSFQFSGVGLTVVGLGAVAYLIGVRTLRRRGDKWSPGRTVAWFLGLATVGYATMGGLGVYSHVMFSYHMLSHMLLSMLAPVLLVMGAPITLALRALPGPDSPGGDGPRQLLMGFLNSTWSRVVTNPAFATIMFIASLYAIYFTGIYDVLMSNHLGHALMEVHFLLAGYLYYEVLIGLAPLPKRLPHLGRLGLVLVVAPFHAFFAISLMSGTSLIGGNYYATLNRPYATDLLADQNLGGAITWAMGELPLLVVSLVLLFQWFRDDTRRAAVSDRRAEKDDRELREYNEYLARIASGDARRTDRDPSTRTPGDD